MRRFIPGSTGETSGFFKLWDRMEPLCAYGRKVKRGFKPFFPGQEGLLEQEFDRLASACGFSKSRKTEQILKEVRDIRSSLDRLEQGQVLDIVEIFEIKHFILQSSKIRALLEQEDMAGKLGVNIHSLADLFSFLDPGGGGMPGFAVYDEFSTELKTLREEVRGVEQQIGGLRSKQKIQVEEQYRVRFNFDDKLVVPKSDAELIGQLLESRQLNPAEETFMSLSFTLKSSPELDRLQRQAALAVLAAEKEEKKVILKVCSQIRERCAELKENTRSLGTLDFLLAKAGFCKAHNLVRPGLLPGPGMKITGGVNLVLAEVLEQKQGAYTPVSLELGKPVTCITGINMGGKTVVLRMLIQIAALAQYGVFVPCESAQTGLFDFLFLSSGNTQSISGGLSHFGSQVVELQSAFDRVKKGEKALVLIDEPAVGTNPKEGAAITRALIGYLEEKPCITVITTHFSNVIHGKNVQHLRVHGLQQAPGDLKPEQLSQYLDYTLIPVDKNSPVPRCALDIAGILGLEASITLEAQRFLNEQEE